MLAASWEAVCREIRDNGAASNAGGFRWERRFVDLIHPSFLFPDGRTCRERQPDCSAMYGRVYFICLSQVKNASVYSSSHTRLNRLDKVEHSLDDRDEHRALHAVTEMNFGLRSAGNARLVRHGRPGRRSTYLRTAVSKAAQLRQATSLKSKPVIIKPSKESICP